MTAGATDTPRVVLDTNAVLDWLVFRRTVGAGFGRRDRAAPMDVVRHAGHAR